MKSLFVASLVFVALAQPAMAGHKKKHLTHKAKASASASAVSSDETAGGTKRHLGTDHSFSAADINGRYQVPAGTAITVENDKDLIDLLGVRKHFKDRLDVETTRN